MLRTGRLHNMMVVIFLKYNFNFMIYWNKITFPLHDTRLLINELNHPKDLGYSHGHVSEKALLPSTC